MTATGAAVLAVTLAVVTVTDLRRRIIPNRVVLTAGSAGLILAFSEGPASLGVAVFCAALVAGPMLAVALVRPEGMGMGDVKLAALIGLFMGWQAWPALLAGLALGAMAGVLISLGTRTRPSQIALPLAPFLAAGAIPVLLATLKPLQ